MNNWELWKQIAQQKDFCINLRKGKELTFTKPAVRLIDHLSSSLKFKIIRNLGMTLL